MTTPRVDRLDGTTVHVELGIDYTDGYRVRVTWDEVERQWLATIDGLAVSAAGMLAYGPTKEAALLGLCCSLAALVDCIGEVSE